MSETLVIHPLNPLNAYCSFCGKTPERAERLIGAIDKRGVDVYICDECVEVCRLVNEYGMLQKLVPIAEEAFRTLSPR